jgi:hypothetical protein
VRNRVTATAQHTHTQLQDALMRKRETTTAQHTSARSDHEKQSNRNSTTHNCKKGS